MGGDGRIKDRQGVPPQGVVFGASMISDQTVAQWGELIFNGKLFDPWSWYSTTTGRFTPKVPGYYRFEWRGRYSSVPSGGWARTQLAKNGASWADGDFAQGTMPTASGGSAVVYLNGTTDYVSVLQSSSDGASRVFLSSASDPEHSYFYGTLIGSSIGITPEPWQSLAPYLANGWVGYNGTPYFRKMPSGMVIFRGEITGGSTTVASVVFGPLPPGYRPLVRSFPVVYANNGPRTLDVEPNGNVLVQDLSGPSTHIHGLAQITYYAEN